MTPEFWVGLAVSVVAIAFFNRVKGAYVRWRSPSDPRVDEVLPACRYELPDGTVVRICHVETGTKRISYHIEDEWCRWQEELEVDAAACDPQLYWSDLAAFLAKAKPYVDPRPLLSSRGEAGALSLVPRPKHFRFQRRKSFESAVGRRSSAREGGLKS